MQIHQKQVTTVSLHHGTHSGFMLRRDGKNFQLSIVDEGHVVHLLLSAQDLQRLRQEIALAECQAKQEMSHLPTAEKSVPAWASLDWLCYN